MTTVNSNNIQRQESLKLESTIDTSVNEMSRESYLLQQQETDFFPPENEISSLAVTPMKPRSKDLSWERTSMTSFRTSTRNLNSLKSSNYMDFNGRKENSPICAIFTIAVTLAVGFIIVLTSFHLNR